MRIIGFLMIAVTATMAAHKSWIDCFIGTVEHWEAEESTSCLNNRISNWNQRKHKYESRWQDFWQSQKDEEKRIVKLFVQERGEECVSRVRAGLRETLWQPLFAEKTRSDQSFTNRTQEKLGEMLPELQKLALKAYRRIDHDKIILATEQLMAIKQIISEEKQLLGDTKEKLGVSQRYMPNNKWFSWVPSADFSDASDWKNIEKLEDLKAILESKLDFWTNNVEYPSWSNISNENRIKDIQKDISQQMKIIVHEWPVFDEFLEKSKTHTANLKNVIKQLGNKIKSAKAKSAEIEEKEGDKSDLQ